MPSRIEHAPNSREILPGVQLRREFRSFTFNQLIEQARANTASAVAMSLKKEQDKLQISGDSVISAEVLRGVIADLDKSIRDDDSVGSHFLKNEKLLVETFFDTILESNDLGRRAFEGLRRYINGSVHH